MIIDATFEEKNTEILANFGDFIKGEKGDSFRFEDLTPEQKAELGNTAICENHEKRITNLEKKISPEYFTTDADVAHRKIVPTNVCPFAQIDKVGGMTYKTRNLIPFPYILQSGTKNGTTYTFGTDGTITIDKTPTAGFVLDFAEWKNGKVFNGNYTMSVGNTPLPIGSYIALLDAQGSATNILTGGQDKRTTQLNGTYYKMRIWISVDGTYSNNKLYPMLNEGTEALPYEPYFEGLRDTSVTELVSEGANIANVSYNQADWLFAENKGTFISSTENSIEGQGIKGATPYKPYTSNGWLTMREAHAIASLKPFKAGYKISLSFDFEILELPSDYTNSNGRIEIGAGFGFIGKSGSDLWKGTSINFVLGVQRVAIAFAITNAQANLTPVMRIAFSSLHARVSNIMINYGDVAPYKPYRAEAVDTFPISAELRAFLEQYGYGQGNPNNPDEYNYIDFEGFFVGKGRVVGGEWVAYGEPIEIDISAYLPDDNFIAVEGGGVIRAVNDYEYDAPSEINYMLKEGNE